MLRGPQILAWSCPLRPLLLLRETHLAAVRGHPGAGWQGAAAGTRGGKEGPSLCTGTVSCTTQLSLCSVDCDRQRQSLLSKAISSSHHRPPQVCSSAEDEQASDCCKCTVGEDLGQPLEAVSTDQDCLANTACLEPWRRPWDICQPSHSSTSKTTQSLFCHRLKFVRPPSSSTRQLWVLNHFHRRAPPPSISVHHTRAVHQAAPCVTHTWGECLSPQNENRCRQCLGSNLKLYEVDKWKKDWSQSQGRNQARWASVLVSLCSVEGDPAFLFTLRSSTLKGRHKGDVSFAGGKSDPSDRDVVSTALREAREELGVTVGTERVWGVLKPLRDTSGMMIAPVLANLGPLEELSFKPNPAEVEEIFTLSLSHLCNPVNRGYTHFRTGDKYGYTLPVFRNGKHRVWGLTAVALDHTLKLIVPP